MGNVYLHPTAKRRRRVSPPAPPEMQREIVTLYEGGWSSGEIAKEYHRAPTTIRSILRRNGVEIRSKHSYSIQRLSNKEIDRTVFLYTRCGMSQRDVANFLGIAHNTVYYRLVRAGVPRRSKHDAGVIGAQKVKMKKKPQRQVA